MLDNFDVIKPVLNFRPGEFYFIQILKRKKDNPDFPKNESCLKYYTVESLEILNELESSIKEYCETHKARAYIHPSPRSWKKVSLEMLKDLAIRVSQEDYFCKELFASACGKTHTDKIWVVDLDISPEQNYEDFLEDIREIEHIISLCPPNPLVIERIKTRFGWHLLVPPFDLKLFQKYVKGAELKMPDIHKNNPTVLYIPSTIVGAGYIDSKFPKGK